MKKTRRIGVIPGFSVTSCSVYARLTGASQYSSMNASRKRLELVIFDAGGGHRAAAQALQTVIEQQGRFWQVEIFNLQEALDPLDPLRRFAGLRTQDFYNLLLRTGWTLGAERLLGLLHLTIRCAHPRIVRLLSRSWETRLPDLVISLVPHFNRALRESLSLALPSTPFITLLTDFADHPPHYWIERQEQFLICGTERAVLQARALGYSSDQVFRTSGMILHPRFYEPPRVPRDLARRHLGLHPSIPTGLVLFGGQGSQMILEIASRLNGSSLPLQLIVLCGRNQQLIQALRACHLRYPIFATGFTTDVPHYMRLADFFIGKPGPGSISEAVAMGLPVIVESNAWTLPQERYNAVWVKEMQVGLVVKSFHQIVSAVEELLAVENFTMLKSKAAAIRNRAVYEVPDILDRIMNSGLYRTSVQIEFSAQQHP